MNRNLNWWLIGLMLLAPAVMAQTSWKGTSSTAWGTAANWTAGVPTASVDAIIGDANFTGTFQPRLTSGSGLCRSLTLGTGTKASTLTVSRSLTVSGSITIGSFGTLSHTATSTSRLISLSGNWVNSGTYTTSSSSCGVTFNGITQSISGSTATAFRRLTISASSTNTLAVNISVASALSVSGKLDPGAGSGFVVSGAGTLSVANGGKILVRASTFAGNYTISGTKTLNAGSMVDYAASGNQTVANTLTYSTLRISGSGVKTLAGNLLSLVSSPATAGVIDVAAGTLDLSIYTANRGTTLAGGTITVAAGATLKIGGTGTFPANYATHALSSTGTVEYSGANQTVTAESYGNLTLSGSSGAVVKSMPGSALSISGNLTASQGSATTVSFTAGGAFTIGGNLSLGTATTFSAGSFSHSVGGNWVNNGTFTGGTSTVTMNGVNTVISGSGANNFYNLTIGRSGITADASTSLDVAGSFATTGAGTFTHTTGGAGTVTMSGASKTISGTGITFSKLTLASSISTAASFTVGDNLTVNGSLAASAGTITLSGTGKTISGSGTIAFSGLNVPGTITTANSFSMAGNLSVVGSLIASAGMVTFNGSTVFSGTANLNNTTLNGTLLRLGADSILRLAGTTTLTAGTFDVTTQRPNTIVYNGAGDQTVYPITYDTLEIAAGGTKAAGGNITVWSDLKIDPGAIFSGGSGSYTIYVRHHWLNSGTFSAGNSTVEMWGPADSTIAGATSFNQLRVNKDASTLLVSLSANQTAATLDMFLGTMDTGASTLTITSTRTGNGHVIGTITRQHSFTTGTSYAFESPFTTLTFASLGSVSSVTVTTTLGSVGDFPAGAAVNRQYTVSLDGTYSATFRAYYQDSELNGNAEGSMVLWKNSGSWTSEGKTGNDVANNWVEMSPISSLNGRWTMSSGSGVVRWNGSSSIDWGTAANWTVVSGGGSVPPAATDIVELGTVAGAAYQPTITSSVSVRSIWFGSAQAITLTLGTGGLLTTSGNVSGSWTGNATHTINVGDRTLNVGGDLALSDGTSGHAINLSLGTGTVTVTGNLVESGGASVVFTGAGTLNLAGGFLYTSGTFTAGTGTVNYTGSSEQTVGGVTYNQLGFSKTAGIATLPSAATVNGNLALTTGGRVRLNANLIVAGNVSIGTATTLDLGGMSIDVGGNWTCDGTLNISSGGEVALIGTGAQTIGPCAFHDFDIEKPSGTATLAGNISVVSDVDVNIGTLDMGTYTVNQSSSGAIFTMAAGATLRTAGSFPTGFTTITLDPSSTVEYYGSGDQTIAAETYGHLTVINGGGSHLKTLAGPITVAGNLLIGSTAALAASSYSLTLLGNWQNNGTFTAGTGTVVLSGSAKTVNGATTFNNLSVPGSYTVANCDIHISGNATILGSYAAGSGVNTIDGDLLNAGTMSSTGTTTFTGTRLQTIQLLTAIQSISSGIVNFNGTFSPVLNSTTPPLFANVNINNTAGVTASVGWTVVGGFTVASGAAFNGSGFTHVFYGTVANSGSMTSGGMFDFSPATDTTLALGSVSSSGIVAFSGANHITISSGALSLGSIRIANTHAAGITPVSNWTLAGDLDIDSGATFHAGSGLTHKIAGDFNNQGTLDGGTSTFEFNGTSTLAGAGSTVFNNVLVSGSLADSSPISVTGNFVNNGSFAASGADVRFTGSSASAISGSTTPTTIDSLVIAKTSATVTLAVIVNGVSSLTISGGTLDTGSYSLSQNATDGGTLSIGASGTLKLGGDSPFPTFSNGVTLDPACTVNYAGTAQTVAAISYANLVLSGSGNKTLSSTNTINGNVEISGTAKFNLTYASASYSPVGSLTFGGAVQAAGTWGSSSSSAGNKTDTYFQGTGKLNVGNRNLDHFAVTVTSDPQTAGTPFNITTITAQDANNNTVGTFTGTVDLTETGDGAGGTVSPSQSIAFTAGVLSGQSVTLTKAGAAVTITVADHAGTGKSGVSDPFTVNAGALNRYAVTFSTPPYQVGVPFTTIVTAQDANNNTVTADSSTVVVVSSSTGHVEWQAPGSSEFDNGLTAGQEDHVTRTLTNGVALFNSRDLVTETCTVTATSSGPTITGTSASIQIESQAGSYRSKTSGNWGSASTWEAYDGSAWVNAVAPPTYSAGVILIQSGHIVTVAADIPAETPVDQVHILSGGRVNVSTGVTLTIGAATSPGLEVHGTLANAGTLACTVGSYSFVWGGGVLQNSGTVNSTIATLEFEPGSPGGKYQHLFTTTAGTIPTAEWEGGSICEIVGYTDNTGTPDGLNQSFYDFTWNCPNQGGGVSLGSSFTTVAHNFTVTSTGSGSLTLGHDLAVTGTATVSSDGELNCGTYKITGAAFTLSSGGTLGIGSADGISSSGNSGNIQTTTRTFATDGDYLYNGTAAQTTGSGLPANVHNLTIQNSAGVTLTAAETVSGTVALGSTGKLKISTANENSTANALTIGGLAQFAGSWGSTLSSATHKDDTRFDSTGSGLLNVTTSLTAYRITANTTTPTAGVADQLTITLVDAAGNTITSFSGDISLTFSGLANADDGTHPTVTGKNGTAVAFGSATTITFSSGVSTAGGSLVGYKAESSVTLNATDGTSSTTSTGGAGVSLTIANVAPVGGAHYLGATVSTPLNVSVSALANLDYDANHDKLTPKLSDSCRRNVHLRIKAASVLALQVECWT